MFNNIRLATKITLGFLTLALFTFTIGVTSFYYIQTLNKSVENIKKEAEEAFEMETLRVDYLQKFRAISDYVATKDTKNLGIFYIKKQEIEAKFLRKSSSYIDKFSVIPELRIPEELKQSFNELNDLSLNIIQLVDKGEEKTAKEKEISELNPLLASTDDLLKFSVKKEKADLKRAQVQALRKESQAGKIMILSVLFTFLVSIFLGIRLRFSVQNALGELQKGIREMKLEHFDYEISVINKDEIGEVSEAFNNMAKVIQKSRGKIGKHLIKIEKQKNKSEDQKKEIGSMLKEVKSQKNFSQRLAEDLKKFQLAVEGASDHIMIADANMKILYANKAAEEITGYPRREILKKPLLWSKKLGSVEYQKIWNRVIKKNKTFIGELKGERKNGEEYFAEVHIAPLVDEKGILRFLVEIDRDVTKAKAVDRVKTEFVTLASHQLRTPLSALKWLLEMLLDGDAGAISREQREMLEQASSSNNRMIMLVNNLLNVARLDAGTMLMNPQIIDVEKMTNTIIKEIKPLMDEKSQTLEFACMDCKVDRPKAFADENVFNQVMSNLISNSIKYTPKDGKITIKISPKQNHVLCEVIDNGLGIPKLEQPRVFNQFFRAFNVTKTDTQGSGLGLYAAKLMIEFSRGKIGFKSAENKGTTFWFTLPKAT